MCTLDNRYHMAAWMGSKWLHKRVEDGFYRLKFPTWWHTLNNHYVHSKYLNCQRGEFSSDWLSIFANDTFGVLNLRRFYVTIGKTPKLAHIYACSHPYMYSQFCNLTFITATRARSVGEISAPAKVFTLQIPPAGLLSEWESRALADN